jgi:hypothetical protein
MYPKDYFQYIRALRDDRTLSSSAKHLAQIIASHHDFSSDRGAFPSVALLAEECSTSPATVHRAKQELIENGWLESKRRWNDSNLYDFAIPSANTALPVSDNMSHDTMSLPMSQYEISHNESTDVSNCDIQMSQIEELNTNINTNLNTNISSSAAWESEDISSQEEEKVLLETRGTSSIPLDYLKYLSLDYSFNDVRHLVEDPTLRKAILDKRREEGIF